MSLIERETIYEDELLKVEDVIHRSINHKASFRSLKALDKTQPSCTLTDVIVYLCTKVKEVQKDNRKLNITIKNCAMCQRRKIMDGKQNDEV